MTRNNRQAFTVVELLVVIAIIGVLMALLLGGVQAARVLMWKTQCASQIRQLGIAEQAFETAKGYMSASRSYPPNLNRPNNYTTTTNAQGWVHPLLPHLERNDLAEMIEGLAGNGSLSSLNLNQQTIKQLVCPADNSETNNQQYANRNSYAVNGGRFNGSPSGSLPLDWPENGCIDDRLKGSMDSFRIFRTTKGDLVRGDGASNTLMFVENADAPGWTEAANEWDVAVVWSPSSETYALNRTLRRTGDAFGKQNARPSSFHANGFNVCFADGAVKYIADSIDYAVYAQLMTSNSRQLREPSSNTASSPPAAYTQPLSGSSY